MDVCLRQLDTIEALVVKGTLNPDSLNLNGIAYLILGFHIEPLDHGIPWVSSATAKIGKTFAVTGRVSRPEHNGQSTSRFGCRSFQYTQQKKWSYIVDENFFPKHPILDGHTEINV